MHPLIDKTDGEYAASSNLWPPKLKKPYLVAYRLLPPAAIPVLAPEAPPPAHLQPPPKKKKKYMVRNCVNNKLPSLDRYTRPKRQRIVNPIRVKHRGGGAGRVCVAPLVRQMSRSRPAVSRAKQRDRPCSDLPSHFVPVLFSHQTSSCKRKSSFRLEHTTKKNPNAVLSYRRSL